MLQILENKEKFFWSKSNQGEIVIGGSCNGRFYGTIVFAINKDVANMKIDVSNGISSSYQLTQKEYDRITHEFEYSYIKEIFNEMDSYLKLDSTGLNQEIYREDLMKNLMDFLPQYSF